MALCAACGGGSAGSKAPAARLTLLALVAGSAGETGNVDAGGAAARFNQPVAIAADGAGNLFVADRSNCAIRKITPAGAVSTLAGGPQRCGGEDGGAGTAGFAFLTALALAPDGRLFVTDGLKVREVSPAGTVRTVATLETATVMDSADTPYFYGAGIAVDRAGNLVVANAIGTRKISPSGSYVMLDGVAKLDSLINVWGSHAFVQRGVAVDAAGNVVVGDLSNTIARIDASGKKTSLAGLSGATGFADGSGSVARFNQVIALVLDGAGALYAADAGNNMVRRMTPDQMVTTVAGTLNATGLQVGNAPGALPALAGLAGDGKGTLYAIAGNAVVKITLP